MHLEIDSAKYAELTAKANNKTVMGQLIVALLAKKKKDDLITNACGVLLDRGVAPCRQREHYKSYECDDCAFHGIDVDDRDGSKETAFYTTSHTVSAIEKLISTSRRFHEST